MAFQIVGHVVTMNMAAEAGQLQLNAFEPVIAHSLFTSMTHRTPHARRWYSAASSGSPPTDAGSTTR